VAIDRRLLEFSDDDLAEVVSALHELREGDWVNIEPYIDQADLDDLRARSPHPLVRAFQKAGAPIPLGTIARTAHGLSIGLEHSHGARALPFLREHEAGKPADWKLKQDHPRRGMVFEVPATTDLDAAVRWILRAAKLLASVRVGREWTALVCRPA
jgi:hypothetical protein